MSETSGVVAIMSAVFSATVIAEVLFCTFMISMFPVVAEPIFSDCNSQSLAQTLAGKSLPHFH